MRIGVNALYLIPGGVGGTEIYLRSLLEALAEIDRENEYFVFTNRETGGAIGPSFHRGDAESAEETRRKPKGNNFHILVQDVRATSRPARILWEQTVLPIRVARLGLDVLFNPGFTAPLLCSCPQVTVFHDLQHKRHPQYFRWWDLPFWSFFLYWAAQVSRRVIAVSEATAADLEIEYRVGGRRIRVVPHGVGAEFFTAEPPRRGGTPFLLAVSTLHPHKNLEGLLQAFSIFHQRRPEFRLVVCGMHGFVTGKLHKLRERLGLADCVEFPGWIPREDLLDLFRRAYGFVYPSRFEGFGMPVLEAMAAGLPMACSNIEPLVSIVGGAAVTFDPYDISAMAEAMRRIVEDGELRERLMVDGPARAAQFTWRSTAEKTLAVLREVAECDFPAC
jgi:glycosyltransferase involved in cell wall biosynthesis